MISGGPPLLEALLDERERAPAPSSRCSWLWVFDVFRTFFVLWTRGGSPLSTMERCAYELDTWYTSTTAVSHLLYCCITHGGWVDCFVGVTAVLRTAVLLYEQYRVVGG